MTNIYLLISLGFLAGSIITGTILWLRLSGKLRSALDKSIRLEAESNLRINIKEELKKELSSATEDAISPIKNYVIKEIGNAETVRSDAKLKLEELNTKQNDTVNTIVSRFEQINIKTEYSANSRGKKNELVLQELIRNTKFVEGKNVHYNKKLPDMVGIPDVQFLISKDSKLIADAKAPLEPFDEYFDAIERGDLDKITAIKTKIGQAIKDHIDTLSKKNYHKSKGAFKHVLMFLPSENHVQIARESSKFMQEDLENYAQKKNILITGPRNFLIDLDWFDLLMSMEENNKLANELMNIINPLFSASKVLFNHFVDHSKNINQVVKSAEKINSSFSKTFINTLQKVKDKGYKNDDIEDTLNSANKLDNEDVDQVNEPQNNLYKLDTTKKKKD